MSYDREIEVNTHVRIGPYQDTYGHGPVTIIGEELHACLDCGYLADDIRMLAHVECSREQNAINTTWREHLEQNDIAGALPEPDPDEDWPITDE